MNKKFVLSLLIIVSIFSVFAVGFHTANEILSGEFSGNYNYTGKLDFTNAQIIGSGTSSMVSGWPDAIICTVTNPNWNKVVFFPEFLPYSDGTSYVYSVILSSGTYRIKFNPDGSFNSLLDSLLATSDCGKSITELYNDGQAFNLAGAFGITKIECPVGFTSIESQGRQLGCMQIAEEGSSSWDVASQDCWNTYGARLPYAQEWFIATSNYILTNEINDWEWVGDLAYSPNKKGIVGNGAVYASDFSLYSATFSYRCFIAK